MTEPKHDPAWQGLRPTGKTCTCPDPWCMVHATCGACGEPVIILDEDDPAFCPACGGDVMPARACDGSVHSDGR